MKATIQPSFFHAKLQAPVSKSAMQRACAAALVRKGRSVISNPGISNDDKAAINIIRSLGADVEEAGGKLIVQSKGVQPRSSSIYCGESGLSVRMFTSIAALSEKQIDITGSGSLLSRPMHFFEEVFPALQVACVSSAGKLPFTIKGPLRPADITIDGSLSSQYLTGLLFAYSALGARSAITVKGLASKPYIDLTLKMMEDFRLPVPVNHGYERFEFTGQSPAPGDIDYTVEGDWSGAAFLLVAAAIAGEVKVTGLDVFSTQADKAILQVLQQAGAIMSVEAGSVRVQKTSLQAFHYNATDCPDLFPPLVALACFCEGISVIEGVGRLKHKESDRGYSLQQEFTALGAGIQIQDDLMIVRPAPLKPTRISSAHNDHRITMALAVTALGMGHSIEIDGAESVNKSYPAFWDHLKKGGASLSLSDN
jgi:3-phosphoshikimate 1-carboxyvinyltransferase